MPDIKSRWDAIVEKHMDFSDLTRNEIEKFANSQVLKLERELDALKKDARLLATFAKQRMQCDFSTCAHNVCAAADRIIEATKGADND